LPLNLCAPGRLRREEAAGCDHATSHTEPGASADRRNHSALCDHRAGKCQHRDLPLPARDHLDRFKNRASHACLQKNETRKMRSVVGRLARAAPPFQDHKPERLCLRHRFMGRYKVGANHSIYLQCSEYIRTKTSAAGHYCLRGLCFRSFEMSAQRGPAGLF
jgi:hypothetical protein